MKREQLISTIFENTRTIKRVMYGTAHGQYQDMPISHAQFELLFTIGQLQPISFKDLAARLFLTPGAISQLVEVLEQTSLVIREADTSDRRIQRLRLSRTGMKLLEQTEAKRQASMEAIIKELTTEELEIWARVQQKLINHIHTTPNTQSK
jgi:DNA-binding MarR family transcriptional regulator